MDTNTGRGGLAGGVEGLNTWPEYQGGRGYGRGYTPIEHKNALI